MKPGHPAQRRRTILKTDTRKTIEIVLFSIFVIFGIYVIYNVSQSTFFEQIAEIRFSPQLSVSVTAFAALAAMVSTFSSIFFVQERKFRDLLFTMASINMGLNSFLYLVAHKNSDFVRQLEVSYVKSDTLLGIGFLAVTTCVLIGTVTEDWTAPKWTERLTIFLLGIIVPTISFTILLIQYQVIVLSFDQGYMHNLGLVAVGGMILLLVISVVYMLREWNNRTTSVMTGRLLMSVLLIISLAIKTLQSSEYQSLELVSVNLSAIAFLILAISMIGTSMLEPHRALSDMVERRTKELELSKQESEFYLFIWAHDVGNALQGISTYLELIPRLVTFDDPTTHMHQTATELTDRTTDIVRLVNQLTQIKAKEGATLSPISVGRIVEKSIDLVRSLPGGKETELQFKMPKQEIMVLADDLIDQVFINLVQNRFEFNKSESPYVKVGIDAKQSLVEVFTIDNGPPLPNDVYESLFEEFVPSKTSMGLRLFIVKQLVNRYNGTLEYKRLERTGENRFVVRLNRHTPDRSKTKEKERVESTET